MPASFDSYKIFYYVGKYKNITHAASALFISQSTVSRSIQSLEAELGCKLFDRTQHGVAFTVVGDVLFKYISRACEQVFMGEEKVLQMQKLASGDIRLGVSDFLFESFTLPAIADFHRDFPSVRIEIISLGFGDTESVLSGLASGRLDVACSSATFADGAVSNVNVSSVATYTDRVIANSRFAELRSGSFFFSDLASYPFVSLSATSQSMSYLSKVFLGHGITVKPEFEVDSVGMFLPIVRSCPCLAIVPTIIGDDISNDPSVFEVRMKEKIQPHEISIITSTTSPQSIARDTFVRQLNKFISMKAFRNIRSR